MHHLLSTAAVEPSQRLAYWVDMVCDTYVELECDPSEGAAGIEGEIAADTLATLRLSRVTATAQHVRRTAAKVAASSDDYFLVSIQTEGLSMVSQDGRDARLAPGDFALYDSTRPYELRFEGPFQQFVLMLPGPTLRTAPRAPLTAVAVSASVPRSAVRSVGPGSISTNCWNGPSKRSS